MTRPVIRIMRLPHGQDIPLPAYATEGAVGMDICAAVDADLTLAPGARMAVPTGLAMAIEPGYEVQLRPRSGLALKNGISLANAPGTIDSDYRGEVKVLLVNLGDADFVVSRAMRIAQMVIAPVTKCHIEAVVELTDTPRGDGGFGSTGV
ncbi:MAG: dUTP diphosphatase [Candidatus Puniceispirillaceae bacterium]